MTAVEHGALAQRHEDGNPRAVPGAVKRRARFVARRRRTAPAAHGRAPAGALVQVVAEDRGRSQKRRKPQEYLPDRHCGPSSSATEPISGSGISPLRLPVERKEAHATLHVDEIGRPRCDRRPAPRRRRRSGPSTPAMTVRHFDRSLSPNGGRNDAPLRRLVRRVHVDRVVDDAERVVYGVFLGRQEHGPRSQVRASPASRDRPPRADCSSCRSMQTGRASVHRH